MVKVVRSLEDVEDGGRRLEGVAVALPPSRQMALQSYWSSLLAITLE